MSTTDIDVTLAALWNEQLGAAPAGPDSDFVAEGGTSIGAVHLAASIQEQLGVAIDAIEILERATYGRISDLVAERADART